MREPVHRTGSLPRLRKDDDMRKEGYGFPEMLAAALRICDVTQTELARRCGISNARISRYASGERTPSIDVAMQICDALDMDLGDFARLGYVRVEAEVPPEVADGVQGALKRSDKTLDDAFEAFLIALAARERDRSRADAKGR